jgi:ParB/RepB/Spo0J family partition protein
MSNKEQGVRTLWTKEHPIGLSIVNAPVAPNRSIPIGEIHIDAPNRFHKLDDDVVKGLMESIKINGLITPITVTPELKGEGFGYRLIAGHHRIEAARKLLWNEIPAQIKPYLDPDDTALAEIDDNLVRGNLSDVERGQHLDKRAEIHDKKYAVELAAQDRAERLRAAETYRINREKSLENEIHVQGQPKPLPNLEGEETPPKVLTGIQQAAKTTGIDYNVVQKSIKAVRALPDIGRIAHTPLDKGLELAAGVRLIKTDPEVVEREMTKAAAGDKTVSFERIEAKLNKAQLNIKTERLLVTLLYHMRKSETAAGRQIVFDRVREVYEHPETSVQVFEAAQKKAHDEIRGLVKERKV